MVERCQSAVAGTNRFETSQLKGSPLMLEHWSEDRYWTEAEERFAELRRQGTSKLVLDLESIESQVFSGDSPAYRAMEALASVREQEGSEGYKGAPRVVLALLMLLSELGQLPKKDKPMSKIIYVLTNEAMPGLVKIGLTTDSVESRVSSLSATSGIPLPFECHFAAEVPEHISLDKVEKTLHKLFAEYRVNPKREFFKIEPEKAVLALSLGNFKEVTPGKVDVDPVEAQALEKAKEQRRSRINLSALGIQAGAELVLSRDENVKATVLEGGKVDYKGQSMSLSAAALKALQEMGYKSTSVSGSDYWMYEGELLDERRVRLESDKFESPSNG